MWSADPWWGGGSYDQEKREEFQDRGFEVLYSLYGISNDTIPLQSSF